MFLFKPFLFFNELPFLPVFFRYHWSRYGIIYNCNTIALLITASLVITQVISAPGFIRLGIVALQQWQVIGIYTAG